MSETFYYGARLITEFVRFGAGCRSLDSTCQATITRLRPSPLGRSGCFPMFRLLENDGVLLHIGETNALIAKNRIKVFPPLVCGFPLPIGCLIASSSASSMARMRLLKKKGRLFSRAFLRRLLIDQYLATIGPPKR